MVIASFSVLIFISGYLTLNGNYKKNIDAKDIDQQIDRITVMIIDTKQFPNGTDYSLKLNNASQYLIKQNAVYLSYPILMDNGSNSNQCKVEATGNKLDIRPNEEVMLNVFMPIENFKNNNLIDTQHPSLMIRGYLNEVKETNHFDKSWGS